MLLGLVLGSPGSSVAAPPSPAVAPPDRPAEAGGSWISWLIQWRQDHLAAGQAGQREPVPPIPSAGGSWIQWLMQHLEDGRD